MSSSRTSSHQVSGRLYRTVELEDACVFIKEAPEEEWPTYIKHFNSFLTSDAFVNVISVNDLHLFSDRKAPPWPGAVVHEGEALELCRVALRDAIELHKEVEKFEAGIKSQWMNVNKKIIVDLINAPGVMNLENAQWNTEVDPALYRRLRKPKPDVVLGLRTNRGKAGVDVDIEHMGPLDRKFLRFLREEKDLHPFPVTDEQTFSFPFLVYEANTDLEALFFAENQVANGATAALKILMGLKKLYGDVGGTVDYSFPVVAICSMGDTWEVLLALHRSTPVWRFDLVKIWKGDVSDLWSMLQLQVILKNIAHWVQAVYRPQVQNMLEFIRQSFPPSPEPPLMEEVL